ncbi:gluconate 2-dehydrogenase subunit 3 family protein [Microbacterium sp. LRZ72]|uniref:gluconate 2-dehydrogenase subunit 3 family protein n=1 Tax=Microbacterium sp. LRZ72 TaxID=2942481 RepID=UPI0029B92BD3|nr:gluconate 2-dehydrogenase subunit 3 family protein [Microbacterium sp. LRZ72]MDX2377264.1 gluconate 2-dehydrogenase subunit 3 family protein [Microbacterium sp. LRZ72]
MTPTDLTHPPLPGGGVSRRFFLGSMVAVGGAVIVGCTATDEQGTTSPDDLMFGPPETELPPFFDAEQRRTVQAIVGRIMPGSEGDPGAVEAGAVDYIDQKLARYDAFAQPSYLAAPFVDVVDSAAAVPSGDALVVAESQLYRYGYQSGVLPQELYRRGLAAMNDFADDQYGSAFADLTEPQQDELLMVLDQIQQASESSGSSATGRGGSSGQQNGSGGQAQLAEAAETAFGDLSPGEFFSTVRTDTIEGMFSDPAYGGNEGYAGWLMIGYPGAQRAYTPAQMLLGVRRRPQRLAELPPMNSDRHDHDTPPLTALQGPLPGVKDG